MQFLTNRNSAVRIFAFSTIVSLIVLYLVYVNLGWQATLVALMLVIIELTFSFDNAIINARILGTMSYFWQQMFMTIGILIAVFGMRVIFPVVIVMASSGLGWNEVVNLALNNPDRYADVLDDAHYAIASFGGMFLMMLTLHFFFDVTRTVNWLPRIEEPMKYVGRKWLHAVVCMVVLLFITFLPINHHPQDVFTAGLVGIATYLIVHGMAELMASRQAKSEKQTGKIMKRAGLAGFASFMYLEVLDASFSLDGVIGAFAVTKDVVLIAAGLGIGALWVRSLTLFMVRRETLHTYKYLEHAAHYVIGILAVTLLLGLFYDIPEAVAGLIGIGIVIASITSSNKAREKVAS